MENDLTYDEMMLLRDLHYNKIPLSRKKEYDDVSNTFNLNAYNKQNDLDMFGNPIKEYFNELDIYVDFYRDKLIFK